MLRRCAATGFCLLAILMSCPERSEAADNGTVAYTYEGTRALVALVDRAAHLVATEGDEAFKAFAVRGSPWFHGDDYIFVFDLAGTCLFNAVSPQLDGRNLMDLRDINGKPVVKYITDIGRKPGPDASGWVFYLWQDGAQLTPRWKSAYIRKVETPTGKTYLVGSGVYDIKIERAFAENRVGRAVDLLQTKGTKVAFAAFRDLASPFDFLDAYVFVLDVSGHTVVDPAFPNEAGRDMRDFRDAVGAHPIVELLDKLRHSDRAWVQYLWARPGQAALTRKLIYARKVIVDGKTLIVGTDYFLATPIWMRVEEERPWPGDRAA